MLLSTQIITPRRGPSRDGQVPPGSQINVQGHEKLLKVKEAGGPQPEPHRLSVAAYGEVQSNTELTVDVPATCSAAAGFKVHPKAQMSQGIRKHFLRAQECWM